MSNASNSTTGLAADDVTTRKSWIKTSLSGVSFLYRASKTHFNFWSYVLLLVQTIQVLGFVLRETSFHPIFDLQSVLKFLSLPIYSSWFNASRAAVLFPLFAFLLLLTGAFVVIVIWNSSNSHINTALTISLRVVLEVVITILYIPFMSFFLSFIPCGRSFEPTGITFTEGVSTNCFSSMSLFYRSVGLLGSVMLFCLALAWIVFYDDSPLSKRSFARSHNRFYFWYLISFTCLLVIFFIFHSRFWLFRISYLLVPLFLSYKLYFYLPFYKRAANSLQMLLMGIWIGTAIGFMINSLINNPSNEKVFNLILYFPLFVIFGGVWYVIMKRRIFKIYTTVYSINEELIEKGLIVDGAPGDELDGYDFSQHFAKLPQSFYYFDLLSRALQPKPLKSELLLTVKALYSFGERLFPEDVMFLCLKFLFEINLVRDPIAATVTLSTIKTLDADFKPDESLMISRGIQQLEALRRQQSTGHDVDTSSFLHFQRQQRHLTNLHRDCLDGLYAFGLYLPSLKLTYHCYLQFLQKFTRVNIPLF
ncbi:hypothetical protein GEMRC1_012822 [Eukaryota sp. GEM-RC1]